MTTLVISDLHLGASAGGADVLRQPAPREALLRSLGGVDRLVLLGDVLELREASPRAVLVAARPVLAAIGDAMAGGEIVLVAGNHDYAIAGPFSRHRGRALGLAERVAPPDVSPLAAYITAALAPAEVSVAYPGIWLTDPGSAGGGVYATHGHYLDLHGTLPTFERLAAGVSGRLRGRPPSRGAVPGDYEEVLAPVYAVIARLALRAEPGDAALATGASARAWEAMTHPGPRRPAVRALAAAFPLAVRVLNRTGVGPVSADLSPASMRRSGLEAMREVGHRLGVGAATVVFGHTHRTGPLEGDDAGEWAGLVNTGSWVLDPLLNGDLGARGPYWPGGAVELGADGVPVLRRLLGEVDLEGLSAPRRRG